MAPPRPTARSTTRATVTETPTQAAERTEAEARRQRAARATLRKAHTHFGAVAPLDLAAFVERYPEAACLKLASGSKAANTLRATARVVKQLMPLAAGAPDPAQGLRKGAVALVVHWALRVDEALALEARQEPRAALQATLAENTRDAAERLASVEQSVTRAVGKNPVWRAVYAEGRAQASARRTDLAARLEQCAGGLTALRASSPTAAHSLAMEAVSPDTETDLRAQAESLEAASLALQSPLTAGQDSRALNLLEGQLLHALGDLLRSVRQAREEGRTPLVLRVAPSVLRQLRLSRRPGTDGALTAEPEDADGV